MFLRDTPDRTAIHKENFISVAIASNHRIDLLERTIDSVHRHADMPFEIVVADDAGHLRGSGGAFDHLKDRISRLVLNMGNNTGLAVNANQAIAATRSRNVVFLSDDSLVIAPFMRRVFDALDQAVYVGVLYLGQTYHPENDPIGFKEIAREVGYIPVRTRGGHRLLLHCQHGASWANAFRRNYWLEVGGYSEDDIYGDMPFINKGWKLGYFSAALSGAQFVTDMGVTEGQRSSMSGQAHATLCHYPKIFGMPVSTLNAISSERNAQCSARNHFGRQEAFNEFDCTAWTAYMKRATVSGTLDQQVLAEHHARYLTQLLPDVEAR